LRAAAAPLLLAALQAAALPAAGAASWGSGDRHLEIGGSLRELLTTTNGTDADDLSAAAASDPRCASAALFADCAGFATVSDKDVWQSLTRLRVEVSARASKRWSAELVYDHEWRGGILDLLGDAPPPETFLGLEDEITPFGLEADDDHFRWRHRLYRGFVRYEGARLHVTVGRQRLAWGTGRLWNPIDRLSAIPPLAIEGDEFAGTDAIEARWMFSGFDYLQAVYAPGTNSAEARYALRFHGVVRDTDVSLLAGVFEEALALGGDLAGNLGGAAWRVEAVWTDPSQDVWRLGDPAPSELGEFWQAVLSIDTTLDVWHGIYLLAEHLYDGNALGFGRGLAGPLLPLFGGDPSQPPQPLGPERFAGSRVISWARHTTGLEAGVDLTPALRLDALALIDWRGGSVALAPTLSFSGWNALELRVGAQLFVGPRHSQYGSQQALGFAMVEWFF
jgi:hypothetical protein